MSAVPLQGLQRIQAQYPSMYPIIETTADHIRGAGGGV